MPASWTISTSPDDLLMHITLMGTPTVEDVHRMDLARKSAIGELKCRFNQHLALIDVSGCDVSTPDVAAALQAAIGNRVFRASICAMVVATSAVRMQAKRVVSRSDIYFCNDVAEAKAWLLDQAADRATAA